MQTKSALTSKTILTMGLGGVLAPWVAYLSGQLALDAAISATVVAVVGIGLRFVTNGPVTVTGAPKDPLKL